MNIEPLPPILDFDFEGGLPAEELLPRGAQLISACKYDYREFAILHPYYLVTDGARDELWIAGEPGHGYVKSYHSDALKLFGRPPAWLCLTSAPHANARLAASHLLNVYFRSDSIGEEIDCCVAEGLLSQEEVFDLENEARSNPYGWDSISRSTLADVIRIAWRRGLEPLPILSSTMGYWAAQCPGGSHMMQLAPVEGTASCATCQQSGDSDILEALAALDGATDHTAAATPHLNVNTQEPLTVPPRELLSRGYRPAYAFRFAAAQEMPCPFVLVLEVGEETSPYVAGVILWDRVRTHYVSTFGRNRNQSLLGIYRVNDADALTVAVANIVGFAKAFGYDRIPEPTELLKKLRRQGANEGEFPRLSEVLAAL